MVRLSPSLKRRHSSQARSPLGLLLLALTNSLILSHPPALLLPTGPAPGPRLQNGNCPILTVANSTKFHTQQWSQASRLVVARLVHQHGGGSGKPRSYSNRQNRPSSMQALLRDLCCCLSKPPTSEMGQCGCPQWHAKLTHPLPDDKEPLPNHPLSTYYSNSHVSALHQEAVLKAK